MQHSLNSERFFATYGFGERLVRRSVFEVNERVVEELITRHPLLGSSLQQSRQQLTTAARQAATSWQLQRHSKVNNILRLSSTGAVFTCTGVLSRIFSPSSSTVFEANGARPNRHSAKVNHDALMQRLLISQNIYRRGWRRRTTDLPSRCIVVWWRSRVPCTTNFHASTAFPFHQSDSVQIQNLTIK